MPEPDAHHLLLYEYVPDMAERRTPFREAHLARIRDYIDAGRITMAGGFGDPVSGGAIVFRGVDAGDVEEFARTDAYTQEGLVVSWRVEPLTLLPYP
jgi:uncharacterized protein